MSDKTYDVMTNPSTGNNFDVIADDRVKKFRGGFRLWLGSKSCSGKGGKSTAQSGVIYFRFRVEPVGENAAEGSKAMGAALKSAYPTVLWTGGSSKHGSIGGAITTGKNPFDAEGIIQRTDEFQLGASVYDVLKHLFPTMNFYHDKASFQAYFLELVKSFFGKIESPDGVMGATLHISGMVKEITSVEIKIKELVAELAPLVAETEIIDL